MESKIVTFSEHAYAQMEKLVQGCGGEVAWHGICERFDKSDRTIYYISELMVYPQFVSGAHVDTDEKEYSDWINDLDDETFNNLRFQGHSHVNFACSPSGTDKADQKKIIDQLNDDDFYVFLITNKNNHMHFFIHDRGEDTEVCSWSIDVNIPGDNLIRSEREMKKKMYETITTKEFPNIKNTLWDWYERLKMEEDKRNEQT